MSRIQTLHVIRTIQCKQTLTRLESFRTESQQVSNNRTGRYKFNLGVCSTSIRVYARFIMSITTQLFLITVYTHNTYYDYQGQSLH